MGRICLALIPLALLLTVSCKRLTLPTAGSTPGEKVAEENPWWEQPVELPPGPKTQNTLDVALPSGDNAIIYDAGFSIPAPEGWEEYAAARYLSVLNSFDPSVMGAGMNVSWQGDLHLWHATAQAARLYIPVDAIVRHLATKYEVSVEAATQHELQKADGWKDLGRLNTPIGAAQHLARDFPSLDFRNKPIAMREHEFLFATAHDLYKVLCRVPKDMEGEYLSTFLGMAGGFRIFTPVHGKQNVVPELRPLAGAQFVDENQVRAAEADQRRREMQGGNSSMDALDEANRVRQFNEENAARAQASQQAGTAGQTGGPPDAGSTGAGSGGAATGDQGGTPPGGAPSGSPNTGTTG